MPDKWRLTHENEAYQNLTSLAITTGLKQLFSVVYSQILTKLQKGKPSKKDLPLMKKRYHSVFENLVSTESFN